MNVFQVRVPEDARYHRLFPQLHGDGGGRGRRVQLRPDGHQEARPPRLAPRVLRRRHPILPSRGRQSRAVARPLQNDEPDVGAARRRGRVHARHRAGGRRAQPRRGQHAERHLRLGDKRRGAAAAQAQRLERARAERQGAGPDHGREHHVSVRPEQNAAQPHGRREYAPVTRMI